jgi:hypothetical protein
VIRHLESMNQRISGGVATESVGGDGFYNNHDGSPENGFEEPHGPSASLRIPGGTVNANAILNWPIFNDVIEFTNLEDEDASAFINRFGESMAEEKDSDPPNYLEVPALIENFLRNTHTKNPVCEIEPMRECAQKIAESGPKYDSQTCIVLICCALGCLSIPWQPERPGQNLLGDSTYYDSDKKRRAKGYFIEARKRLGLLPRLSIPTCLCYFLSGVYRMYILQPLEAWHEFYEASSIFKLYLEVSSKHRTSYSSLEQRLFWSCLKSEVEIFIELSLPTSGIADMAYPTAFPRPPDEPNYSGGSPEQQNGELQKIHETSWIYYLTEVLLRRICNRIWNTLYSQGASLWLRWPLDDLISVIEGFEMELEEFYNTLPPNARFEFNEELDNEVVSLLRGRFVELYRYIYRPALFCAIHLPRNDETQPILRRFIDKLFGMTVYPPLDEVRIYRHHGTWYYCREIWVAALLLLAAVKGGVENPSNAYLQETIAGTIATLEYWVRETETLQRCIHTLKFGLEATLRSRA